MDLDVERIKQSKKTKQQIINYAKTKIRNGQAINCRSIQCLFGVKDAEISKIWMALMDLAKRETLFYCIDAYLANEMQQSGNLNHINSETLQSTFKCSREAAEIIHKWLY